MTDEQPRRTWATMKDVARHAGVSLSTVSYVLNDSGPVAAPRRERVLEAVRVLGYTPNEAGRSLKRRAMSTVGMVVPELSNPYFALVVEGVERAASGRDALLVLCAPEAEGATGSAETVARLLRSRRLSGVVYITGTTTDPEAVASLTSLGPVVLVDEQLPALNLPAVVSDNRKGAREMAAHVLARGHTRVAVIGGPSNLWTAQQRLAGYRDAFAAAGLDPQRVPVLEGDYRERSGSVLARKLLDVPADRRPTVLICANDLMAIGALDYARNVGLTVPDDLGVVGFDDLPFSRVLTPRLTTVRQPAHDLGRRAGELLFAAIDGGSTGNGIMETVPPLDTEVQIRDSVGAPPPV
ncbi:LacI family DNA-binding transcriptional regulator [Millisia brevis]|uniref:LacI family DNA-binding transcriptional regulator n=1 Tax=Millisia brevis TaxID=264148 RepID=UPI000A4078A6|nr:LacI family DNA-binding transcriptional regulator [Millisia brevis]